MKKSRFPSAASSLTDANPLSSANGDFTRENTDPLHDEDNSLYDYRFNAAIEEDDVDEGEYPEEPGVESMAYDPIDQHNTTNPKEEGQSI